MIFIDDCVSVLYESKLSTDERLLIVKNMILFFLGIRLGEDSSRYCKSRIKKILTDKEAVSCKMKDWVEKMAYSRYYLSYLKRGLVNYLQTDMLEESALNFHTCQEDILFCYDVLKECHVLTEVRKETFRFSVLPGCYSDSDLANIVQTMKGTIYKCLNNLRFLFESGVVERSFCETELELFSYRIAYMKEGTLDITYVKNYMKAAIKNKADNIRIYYASKKRNSGLVQIDSNVETGRIYDTKNVSYSEEDFPVSASPEFSPRLDYESDFLKNPEFSEADKGKLRLFFSIMRGKGDDAFYAWLNSKDRYSSTAEFEDRNFRNRAVSYCGVKDILKKAQSYWISLQKASFNGTQGNISLIRLRSIFRKNRLSRKECDYLLAKKCKKYSKNFLGFLAYNEIQEKDFVRKSSEDAESWLIAFYGFEDSRVCLLDSL